MGILGRNKGFNLFITAGSVAGFLGGWVLLAHSAKPAVVPQAPVIETAPLSQPRSFQSAPQIAPQVQPTQVPLFNGGGNSSTDPFLGIAPQRQSQRQGRTHLRTGGS